MLRAPVIRSRMQKQSGDALTGIMLDDLQETNNGIGRDDFTQIFPLERNTFFLGMKLLGEKLQLVNIFKQMNTKIAYYRTNQKKAEYVKGRRFV